MECFTRVGGYSSSLVNMFKFRNRLNTFGINYPVISIFDV